MTPPSFDDIERLFHAALELPKAERASYLSRTCGSDPSLLREVESLLAASDDAGDFIAAPAIIASAQRLADEEAARALSGRIGAYEVERLIGRDRAARARELTLTLYSAASDFALGRGIIIADTKFEFGVLDGELVLGDEAQTPDSSRFWPAGEYEPGRAQPSFDKQYVRDHLERIGWNKQPPVPELPVEIVAGTRSRYREIFRILTGRDLA
jgi:phosphoribosylaminoimidazole-succinocarboxamide synthase